MTIKRLETDPRLSEAAIHNGTVYLAGQVGTPGQSLVEQTREALQAIETLLEQSGSSKAHILMATVWLADMADFDAMNAVWDAWVMDVVAPPRATGEVKLASPDYKIEIIVTAAVA